MIDRKHDLPITKQADVLKHRPRQRLLPAAPGVGDRPAISTGCTKTH
jgi:hypothetical protein